MQRPFAFGLLVGLTTLSMPAMAELTPGQMEAATRVFVGDADCEFKQVVSVRPVAGKPGHFELMHKKAKYQLVPQETTTGAVRLEDSKSGVVWIQIPAKSMLLNAKLGQRVVDSCMHAEQRAEAAQGAPASNSFGLAQPSR
jgi:hypothetical protein